MRDVLHSVTRPAGALWNWQYCMQAFVALLALPVPQQVRADGDIAKASCCQGQEGNGPKQQAKRGACHRKRGVRRLRVSKEVARDARQDVGGRGQEWLLLLSGGRLVGYILIHHPQHLWALRQVAL